MKETKQFNVKTYGKEHRIVLTLSTYEFNGATALIAYNCNAKGEKTDLYAVISVNIISYCIDNDEIIADTNNFEELVDELIKNNILTKTDKTAVSGFCTYPIMKINMGYFN